MAAFRSTSTSARTAVATAMPGVRSSSISTRPGSIATRAACKYSSRRCADADTAASATAASVAAATTLFRKLRTVVVGRVAIDRVDVIDAALRRVLDDERRSLHAEVRHAAVGRRAAPGEPRLGQVAANLGHARLGVGVGHDAGPLPYQVEQHGLLGGRQRRSLEALGL